MRKLRHPSLIVTMVFALVLAACGKESIHNNKSTMSEEQAFEQLSQFPMEESRGAIGGKKRVNAEELTALLTELVASGKVKVPSKFRGAVSSSGVPDLSALTNILNLITSGSATNIFSLATQLLNQVGGNGGQVKFDLNFILSILQTAMPIIASVAPQFAPIVQALLVILPMVVTFINMFKKPKPSPTAWLPMIPTLA